MTTFRTATPATSDAASVDPDLTLVDLVDGPGRSSTVRRRALAIAAAAVVAATSFVVTLQVRDDGPTAPVARRATEADLRLAAEGARQMEALAPHLYETSPKPATEADLLLAAEWARRMEILRPGAS